MGGGGSKDNVEDKTAAAPSLTGVTSNQNADDSYWSNMGWTQWLFQKPLWMIADAFDTNPSKAANTMLAIGAVMSLGSLLLTLVTFEFMPSFIEGALGFIGFIGFLFMGFAVGNYIYSPSFICDIFETSESWYMAAFDYFLNPIGGIMRSVGGSIFQTGCEDLLGAGGANQPPKYNCGWFEATVHPSRCAQSDEPGSNIKNCGFFDRLWNKNDCTPSTPGDAINTSSIDHNSSNTTKDSGKQVKRDLVEVNITKKSGESNGKQKSNISGPKDGDVVFNGNHDEKASKEKYSKHADKVGKQIKECSKC